MMSCVVEGGVVNSCRCEGRKKKKERRNLFFVFLIFLLFFSSVLFLFLFLFFFPFFILSNISLFQNCTISKKKKKIRERKSFERLETQRKRGFLEW